MSAALHQNALPTQDWKGLRYFDSGVPSNGPTFVLLHGLGNSLDYWTAVAASVSNAARVIAVDIPGFAQSADPSTGFSLPAIVDDLVEFLRSCQAEQVILVGHSIGAIVAMALSEKLVSQTSVVLISGTIFTAAAKASGQSRPWNNFGVAFNLLCQFVGGSIPLSSRGARLVASHPITRALALWPFVAHPTKLSADLVATALRHNGGTGPVRALSIAREVDVVDLAAKVKVPTTLIWGLEDLLITKEDIEVARRYLPIEAEYPIEGCAHWLMIEDPARLASILSNMP